MRRALMRRDVPSSGRHPLHFLAATTILAFAVIRQLAVMGWSRAEAELEMSANPVWSICEVRAAHALVHNHENHSASMERSHYNALFVRNLCDELDSAPYHLAVLQQQSRYYWYACIFARGKHH